LARSGSSHAKRGRGTAEGGGGGGRVGNSSQNRLDIAILQDILCRNSQYADAAFREPSVATAVVSATQFMTDAVNFDCEPHGRAVEIENVRIFGMLSAKLQAMQLAAAELLPEQYLGQRHFSPQISSAP